MTYEFAKKIYAGLLGMDAGMRLGAPVENPWWTYEQLRDFFGDIRNYQREYNCFAADDDINGPVIFLRALTDFGPEFTARDAGETWLNYTRCGKGMFWWGGEDLSTEHRAYMNLKRGIPAPESGSIAQNGIVAAEQIGGEIFVDTWGLICPDDPARAAEFARRAACVSHDGEGLNGAAFMAAAVAAAFTAKNVDEILDRALEQIPADSHYRKVVDAVRAFHAEYPGDFRACRDMIEREFGVDKYPGYCHIIPNAGVCILDLLYSGGDLGRAIEISVMCGFDTDCNASNVGTILGVFNGLDGVPERYRKPLKDSSVVSSVSGYLNMVDWPSFAKEVCAIACSLKGEEMPEELVLPKKGELRFDFPFPGTSHGLELSENSHHQLVWRPGSAHCGAGCAVVSVDGKYPVAADLSFHASYVREEFSDEQYEPVFSPRVYPGQTVRCYMKNEEVAPAVCTVKPFVLTTEGVRYDLAEQELPNGEWVELAFDVPDLDGASAWRIGWNLYVLPKQDKWTLSRIYVDEITVSGGMEYTIDPNRQRTEFGTVTPFAANECDLSVENGTLLLKSENYGQAYTGNYYSTDVEVCVEAASDAEIALLMRVQGIRRHYVLQLAPDGTASILRVRNGECEVLASGQADLSNGLNCRLRGIAEGSRIALYVDDILIVEVEDTTFVYGMAGIANTGSGISRWNDIRITAKL